MYKFRTYFRALLRTLSSSLKNTFRTYIHLPSSLCTPQTAGHGGGWVSIQTTQGIHTSGPAAPSQGKSVSGPECAAAPPPPPQILKIQPSDTAGKRKGRPAKDNALSKQRRNSAGKFGAHAHQPMEGSASANGDQLLPSRCRAFFPLIKMHALTRSMHYIRTCAISTFLHGSFLQKLIWGR